MSNLSDVKNVEELISFLETKGTNHNYYYHYTSWDSFVKIYTGSSFLLTRGNSLTINDQHEALMKGSWDYRSENALLLRRFCDRHPWGGGCHSYSAFLSKFSC